MIEILKEIHSKNIWRALRESNPSSQNENLVS